LSEAVRIRPALPILFSPPIPVTGPFHVTLFPVLASIEPLPARLICRELVHAPVVTRIVPSLRLIEPAAFPNVRSPNWRATRIPPLIVVPPVYVLVAPERDGAGAGFGQTG